MNKIIECIANFSEGRDQKKIAAIVKAITNVPKIILLGHESDANHNRAVISFAGAPDAVVEAAFQACKKAAQLINLDKHKGEHPRIGAMDVCPLVPIKGLSFEECIKYANKLGERIGKELKIPIYLYGKAAKNPKRINLANVRKGEYEGLKLEITSNPERKPDFGPSKMLQAGASAIGVRKALIAYNVNLKSNNLNIAKAIAKKIRFKDGGFPHVKALGFELKDKGIVQVSMNLTDYKVTSMLTIFNAIKKECLKYNIEILESEIIGLVPQDALPKNAKEKLKISNFSTKQILEEKLKEELQKLA